MNTCSQCGKKLTLLNRDLTSGMCASCAKQQAQEKKDGGEEVVKEEEEHQQQQGQEQEQEEQHQQQQLSRIKQYKAPLNCSGLLVLFFLL